MGSMFDSLFLTILFQGFVFSQITSSDQCSCSLTGGIDLLQKQMNRLQQEVDELKQGSKNNCCCDKKDPNGEYPSDCTELFNNGERTTGVYYVKPSGKESPFRVFCEMAYDGWTVFQRRFNGSEDFYRTWDEYKNGFGDLSGEHWLGNEKLRALTSQGRYIFRFEMHTLEGANIVAEYDGFYIEDEANFYRLHVGTPLSKFLLHGDAMAFHNNFKFSTWDRDNDDWSEGNCSEDRKAGFWYKACFKTNPNGRFGCDDVLKECMYWGHGGSDRNRIVFGDSSILKIKRK